MLLRSPEGLLYHVFEIRGDGGIGPHEVCEIVRLYIKFHGESESVDCFGGIVPGDVGSENLL